jgi:hypothetical protein
MNEDDKVVVPGSEGQDPQEAPVEVDASQSEDASTPSEAAPEEVVLGKPKSHWEKLEQENERLRSGQSTISKRLARYEKLRNIGGENNDTPSDPAGLAEWAKNPMSQELLLKAAETELKEGLDEVLTDYPNLSPDLVKAIRSNPRGFVKPGTVYVDDALIDIEEYISTVSQGEAPTAPPKPKEFPIVGNNGGAPASADSKVNKLLEMFKTKAGVNKAFAMLTDHEVDQKTFDKATELAEKQGLL